MKFETRANLIFIVVFMLIMGPGLLILTRKAYKKGAAGMNPPAPQSVAAYNNPNPQSPLLPRVVPPQTAGYIDEVANRVIRLQDGVERARRDADGLPVMSHKRLLELLGSGPAGDGFGIALFGWDRNFAPLPSLYEFTAIRNGKRIPAKLIGYEQLNIPIDVRSELQKYSFIRPPDTTMWMLLEVPGAQPVEALELRYTMDSTTLQDTILISPPSATRPAN